MPALYNTQKAELVPGHGVFWFIFCFNFFVRILIQRVESYSLCFLQSMHRGFPFAPVHFLVCALAWQAGGTGRCSAFRAVRRLGSLKEKPLQSGPGHILQEALTALLAGGSGGRENVYREEREGKPFNHPSKKQQGLPGMGYHIFTDCSYFSLVIWTYVWQTPWSREQRAEQQNAVWGTVRCGSCRRQEARACSPW